MAAFLAAERAALVADARVLYQMHHNDGDKTVAETDFDSTVGTTDFDNPLHPESNVDGTNELMAEVCTS